MRNILILIPLILLIAACNCDENHPLVSGDELQVPDVFVVTDVSYTTRMIRDDEPEGIEILFNLEIDPGLVIDSLSFFVEGADVYYSGNFFVQDNWIFLPCGNFFCIGSGNCKPAIRLSGAPGTGIRSLDGKLLDGDRDGRPGGDFVQEVSATGCGAANFGLSMLPDDDTIYIGDTFNIPLVFTAFFDMTADFNTFIYDTGDDNVRAIRLSDGTDIQIDLEGRGLDGIEELDIIIEDPEEYCNGGLPCVFRIVIEESVRNLFGLPLDGDGDGIPGKDFTRDYNIVPLLHLITPVQDTSFVEASFDTNRLVLDLVFSVPVGPGNLDPDEDLELFCTNGNAIPSSAYEFFWRAGSETEAWIEVDTGVLRNACGIIMAPDNFPVVPFKVVIQDRVQSTGGIRLDGDKDGAPGGQAVKYFMMRVFG